MSEMAPPAQQKMKTMGTFDGKRANRNQPYNRPGGRKKWVSEHKVFDGSIGEGQGFAFKRKEKVKHEYNKLLRKERRKNTEVKTQYTEQYPEHLRHLYEAEAEKLRNEVKANRINRTKARMAGGGGPVEEEAAPMAVNEAPTDLATAIDPAEDISSDKTDSAPQPTPAVAASKNDSQGQPLEGVTMQHVNVSLCSSLPMSNRSKKKMLRKTSYQKTKEEFESVKEKQKNKKEEFLKNKEQKEEAIKKYKQKKMETFQMLSKKTKKGQPNLNLQMEYLLQKIQGTGPGK
ncbi:thyroid transcription factor 1-associated protein 26 homolog isoform X1 [Oncorhynchus mykiss]|uniref:Coiled-coil domain containing 59 n=1 Tax=Oncorhynchus mykiss TaxID=8022 RepID=A0A8C7T7S4_ONCMY|nr:thyroid transcription factor 1-associated protein 26 homolog isoform X1 [Oncorhynchus mykiss]